MSQCGAVLLSSGWRTGTFYATILLPSVSESRVTRHQVCFPSDALFVVCRQCCSVLSLQGGLLGLTSVTSTAEEDRLVVLGLCLDYPGRDHRPVFGLLWLALLYLSLLMIKRKQAVVSMFSKQIPLFVITPCPS